MNGRVRIGSLVCVILLATMLSSACAITPASTPTLEPTATQVPPPTSKPTPTPIPVPLLSKSPELILAANKPYRYSSIPNNLVYNMPGMDKVLLANELEYYDGLILDIYYPPDYQFETKLPIVILSHGLTDVAPNDLDKDMGSHMDWAKLIAASGMIAISAQAGNFPVENSYHVFDFLAANADILGLDLSRIGFWAGSGQGDPAFVALQDDSLPYRESFKAAVFNYLNFDAADPSAWPKNISLFVVKAGQDKNISGTDMDNFVARARANDIPTEYIELPDAIHGFDTFQDTQASKDTVQQEIEFFKSKLLQ
jgi:hypothetical protein